MVKLKLKIKDKSSTPPEDWVGTYDEWRTIVTLEYMLSQGYADVKDE